MIITCPSCKKKFNIDINLIPSEGRNLQCGSCDNIWFYKKEESMPEPKQINESIDIKEKEESDKLNDNKFKDQLIKQRAEENKKAKSGLATIKETESKPEAIKKTNQNIGLSAGLGMTSESACGEVPEWSNGAVSKTVVGASLPRVRIPVCPPFFWK